jgi:hypothetical protein
MLLQTNIIQNMLIDEGPSYQNLLIPTMGVIVIDDTVIDEDGGAPVKDDSGGGRGALWLDDEFVIVHFDAKTITTNDYDPITNNLLSVKNLADNTDFDMNGVPKFENNALTCATGNIIYEFPSSLQQLFPGDFQHTMICVFSLNQDPSLWERQWYLAAGVLCQTSPYYGSGHTNRMRLVSNEYIRTLDLRVNRGKNVVLYGGGGRLNQPETWGNILGTPDGQKYIVIADSTYSHTSNTHTQTIKLFDNSGSLIGSTENTMIEDLFVQAGYEDRYFSIGGSDTTQNFTKNAINEVLFLSKRLTETELSSIVNLLTEKWNN